MTEYLLTGAFILSALCALSPGIFVEACHKHGISLLLGCLVTMLLWPLFVIFFVVSILMLLRR